MPDNYVYVLKNTKKLPDKNTGVISDYITQRSEHDTNSKPVGFSREVAIDVCRALGMDPDISIVRPEADLPVVLHDSARKLPHHGEEDVYVRQHRDGITLM